MDRRRVLTLLGGSFAVATAGCLGDDDDVDDEPDDANDVDDTDDEAETDDTDDTDDSEPVPDPAVGDISIVGTNAPLGEGELLEIEIDVFNLGDERLEDTLTASIDPEIGTFGDAEIDLEGGLSERYTLELQTEVGQAGVYDVTVESSDDSASTTVEIELVIEADVEIDVSSNEFEPTLVEVDPGDTVVWNHVSGGHTVTFYHEENDTQQRVPTGADALDESLADEDDLVVYEFDEPGVYNYFCRPHEGVGMVGAVLVGTEEEPDQPGLAAYDDDIPEDAQSNLEELNHEIRDILGIAEPQTHDITALATEFSPPALSIDPGDTVRWTAEEGSHTVTYYHQDVEIPLQDEDDVEEGEEIETEPRQHRVPEGVDFVDGEISAQAETEVQVTLHTEGVYDYFCRPHEDIGMVGTIVVGENTDPDQPGLQEPDDTIPEAAAEELRELNLNGYAMSNIPVLVNVVPAANEEIERLNHAEEGSIASMNEQLEEVEGIEFIEPVEAETREEADDEAGRLREEAQRVNDAIFLQLAEEIHARVGIQLVDPEEVYSPETARQAAEETSFEEVEEALIGAADLAEDVIETLNEYADLLEDALILD